MSPRSAAAIEAEIADVRRYLTDVPPHSGSGVRDDLHAKLNALERELVRARAAATDDVADEAVGPLGAAQVDAYLTRIGHRPVVDADAATLATLHRAHVTTVPFENLDIVDHVPIRLEIDALVDKVVTRRRGGFCYELNGLFAALLRSVGYEADLVAAHGEEPTGPDADHDHLRLLVTADDGSRWVADVGNGASWPAPLPLSDGAELDLGYGLVRLVTTDDGWQTLFRAAGEDAWTPEWSFDETAQDLFAFSTRCRWHSTSPESPFTRGLLCTRTIEGGKLTLTDDRLVLTRGGEREEEAVSDVDEVLLTHFGIAGR